MYRLQCFGSASLFDPEGGEVHFRSRKHLGLLLYLCAHRNRSLTRAQVASLFWDSAPPLARHSLSQALYDLRKRIEELVLHARGGTLRLGDGQVLYEAAAFEAAVKAAELERAVDLYRGEFAPNLESVGSRSFQLWLEGERSRFATVGQATLRRHIAECDRQGQWGEVCLAALRLIKMDPLDEAGHRALMKALWLQGDQHSALQHFAETEETLLRELPQGLSTETRALVERIRSSRAASEETRGKGESLLPLVGRRREFRALREGLNKLHDPDAGHLIVVRGEAGIGKTRLVQELKKVSTVEGLTYLESRCYPAESDVAYGPVLDAVEPAARRIASAQEGPGPRYYQLGHLFPDLFDRESDEEFPSVEPAVRRRRLFEEVTDLVRRSVREGPLVWIVEDIQWIDAASASLLHYIARRLMREPMLLVLSLRSGQPMREPARILTEETGPQLATDIVDLAPLSREAIRELLEEMSEGRSHRTAVAFAERYAGGNPFYALEILHAATDARTRGEFPPATGLISDRLRNLLTLRLRGLSSKTLRVLEAVAVLERHAIPEHVAATAGLSRERAATITEELGGRHLLREREGRIEFVHDIAREFVYSNLGLLQRSALHLTAAEILAGAPDVNPATLARHFERGGDRARAYEHGMRAAEASSSSSAHLEAASMAALAAAVAVDADARFEALTLQARAELAAGRFREAEDHFDAILSLYPELPVDRRVPIRISIMKAKVESSDWGGASTCLRILDRDLESVADPEKRVEWELEARALFLKVMILTKNDPGAKRTFEVIRTRLETAERAGELTRQARAEALCSQIVYATFHESSSRAAEILRDLDELDMSSLPLRLQQQATHYRGMVALRLARWDESGAQLRSVLRLARSTKDAFGEANALNNLACLAMEQGNWLDAEHLCRASSSLFDSLSLDDYSASAPMLNLASILFYKGDAAGSRALYDKLANICSEKGDRHGAAEAYSGLSLIALQLGSETDVIANAAALQGLGGQPSDLGAQQQYKVCWAWACLAQHDLLPGDEAILKCAADRERDLDLVSHLKLLWLDVLLSTSGSRPALHARGDSLRKAGLGWFLHFTKRWQRQYASFTRLTLVDSP